MSKGEKDVKDKDKDKGQPKNEDSNDSTKDNNKDKKNKDNNSNDNKKKEENKDNTKENQGKHLGWYKRLTHPKNPNGIEITEPEVFEVTNYINDINRENTEILMTSDIDGNYWGVYTYGIDRISAEDLVSVEGVPNDPLYYLYDAIGTTTAITNMNQGIIDSNRFAPYGKAHDIEAGLVYLRARYYEPETMRFLQQDTMLGDINEPLSRNLYIYGNNNPLKYVDPSGNFAILPLILKAGAHGAADMMLQATMNYLFNPKTQFNIGSSFKAINWWQVGRSAIEGLIPAKKGYTLLKAAGTAVGDVIVNALYYKDKYTAQKALLDFATGFLGSLAGDGINALVNKYGMSTIRRGLKKIGFSDIKINKLTKGTGNLWKNADLLDELASSGVKYSPDDVLAVTKTRNGKLVWLEIGNSNAGMQHIFNHADDFAKKGIQKDQIQDLVMKSLTNGKIVGYQGRGTGRPIYEVMSNENKYHIAITVGGNGFIVGANPTTWP